MLCYEAKAKTTGYTDKTAKKPRYIGRKTRDFSLKYNGIFTFLYIFDEKEVKVGIISEHETIDVHIVNDFLNLFNINHEDIELEEIDSKTMGYLLGGSVKNQFLEDEVATEKIRIVDLNNRSNRRLYMEYEEHKITVESDNQLDTMPCIESLITETNRINEGEKVKMKGHPVHYIIQIDDFKNAKAALDVLLTSLYKNQRIKSKMYTIVDLNEDTRDENDFIYGYEKICKAFLGKTLVTRINMKENGSFDDECFSTGIEEMIQNVGKHIKKYGHELLNIIILPRGRDVIKKTLFENSDTISFIEITEDLLNTKEAKKYLSALATENELAADENLMKNVVRGHSYYPSELVLCFDNWYNNNLRTFAYPQYDFAKTAKELIANNKPKGTAYEELNSLIGLANVKEIVNEAIDYYKAKKLFDGLEISQINPVLHMVFKGNPGTAKTTVARLFARIMRENKILESGHLIEVGRADLIGKYIGHTAPLVQRAFERARGGVLFIDEAYSLVDDKAGLYGDEAISTIVQEMENNRENLIVIFAGYPDKMEEFVDRNPGLKSRIAFDVRFDDYTSAELCEIIKHIAKINNTTITNNAVEKINEIFKEAISIKDFGNGRYARNIFEKAKMKQASRLVKMDVNMVTKEDAQTLTKEDFDITITNSNKKTFGLGGA